MVAKDGQTLAADSISLSTSSINRWAEPPSISISRSDLSALEELVPPTPNRVELPDISSLPYILEGYKYNRQRLLFICERGASGITLQEMDNQFLHKRTKNHVHLHNLKKEGLLGEDRVFRPTILGWSYFENGLLTYTDQKTLNALYQDPELRKQVRFVVEFTTNPDGSNRGRTLLETYDEYARTIDTENPKRSFKTLFTKGFFGFPLNNEVFLTKLSYRRRGIPLGPPTSTYASYEAVKLYQDGVV